MPTRNVNLTDDQNDFVEQMVKAGKYQNASEAVRDALRGLQQRWKEDELKLERFAQEHRCRARRSRKRRLRGYRRRCARRLIPI